MSKQKSAQKTTNKQTYSKFHFERMEPRILLSADAVAGLLPNDPFNNQDSSLTSFSENLETLNTLYSEAANLSDAGETSAPENFDWQQLNQLFDLDNNDQNNDATLFTYLAADSGAAERQEIIFIDAATPDYQTLLNGVTTDNNDTDYLIVILQSDQDGIEQIDNVLSQFGDIEAVHFISHGNDQGIQLGSTWLSNESLTDYSQTVESWAASLDENADFLIYGCNLAADQAGIDLVNNLALLTGADVAASDDFTGAAELSGDWQLEYTVGTIETQIAIDTYTQQNWSYVLGTITVTTTNDVVDTDADTSSLLALGAAPGADGLVSLREALTAANTDLGFDTINLAAGTYALTIAAGGGENLNAEGDLDITDEVSIIGIDAASTIIDGDIPNERIFHILSNNVSISNLSIVNGGTAATLGGGMRVNGGFDVTLTNVTFSNNTGDDGGAIFMVNSTVNLNQVRFLDNIADGSGGAIVNDGGTLSGTDVEFSGNTSAGDGGAINNSGAGTTTFDRALFYNNSAILSGGAILNEGSDVKLVNTTLSANTATTDGGAIVNKEDLSLNAGTLSLINSTLTGNTATAGNGIFQLGTSNVSLLNTILNDGGSNILGGLINSAEYSIDSDNSALLGGTTNLIGNPQLGALADNGGFTKSHALLTGSIAINAGTASLTPLYDQRNQVRWGSTDIGALEFTDYDLIWGDTGTDSIVVSTFNGSHMTTLITGLSDPASIAIDINGGKVYWANDLTGTVERANMDGSGNEVLVTGLTGPISIDLYLDGGKIYWSDAAGTLDRANLDGTAAESITGAPNALSGLAVHGDGDTVYMLDAGAGQIKTTGLTGVGSAAIVNATGANTADLAIDVVNGKIYWSDTVTGEIFRADLADGANKVTLVSAGGSPYGLAIDVTNGRIFWSDSASGEIYSAKLSDGTNVTLMSGGLTAPVDVDVINKTTTVGAQLWLTTNGNAVDNNATAFGSADIVLFDDPDLNFESGDGSTGVTDGTFSIETTFPEPVRAIHYVSSDVTVATYITGIHGTTTLTAGQIVLSMRADDKLDFDVPTEIAGTPTTLTVNNTDIVMYDPSTGYYYMLLEDAVLKPASAVAANIHAITIAEQSMIIGEDTLITAGSYIIASSDPSVHGNVSIYDAADPERRQDLLVGASFLSDSTKQIQGLHIVNTSTTLNGVVLNQGTILAAVTTNPTITVGTGTTVVAEQIDILALTVNQTMLDSTTPATHVDAEMFFDGSDIGLAIDDGAPTPKAKEINGFTLLTENFLATNFAPTATNLTSSSSYTEGDASVAITDIVVSDLNAAEIVTANLTLANTATGSFSANDGATYNGSTGVWNYVGSVANLNTALANLTFNPATNNDVSTTINVSIDDGDEDASGPITGTISLNVTGVNDAPTATNLTSTANYTEDAGSVAITDIVVSDVDDADVITANLTLANIAAGTLSANDGATYNGTTGVWSYTGTVANVNTALANLVFTPATNNDVNTTIAVSIDDGDEDASGALTGTISLNVTAVNDAPTATNLTSTASYNEGDATVAIDNIVVSDVDSADVITANLTLTNTAAGTLSANDGASYNGTTGVWSYTGTVANVNTALANLVFTPATNNDVNTTIAVSIDDGDEDASGALTGTISLNVNAVNNAPTATNLTSASSYNEGDASVAITDIVVSDVDSAEVITANLTLANTAAGTLSANNGATYNSTTGVWSITGVVANINTALANLVFTPATNNDVNTTIAVSIDDGDEDASGALTGTISLNVTAVNDAPTATNLSSTSSYTEGDASVAIADIVVSDVDTAEVITANLTLANTAAGTLSANNGATYNGTTGIWTLTDTVANINTALANLVFTPATNNDQNTTISVNIDDGDEDSSGALTGTISLNVTGTNNAPTATNLTSTSNYTEGDGSVAITDIVVSDVDTAEVITANLTLANTAAGTLSANNGATYNGTTGVWSLTGTVANINTALANLFFTPATNHDQNTTIAVSIDDGDEDASGALTGTISLNVTAVNDAPTATNLTSTSNYNEGDANVAITDIVVSDVDSAEVITANLTLANTAAGILSANNGATYNGTTGVWSLTGTVANVNTALANLIFTPATNNDQNTTIAVSIDDGDEDSSGALTGTISLNVTGSNDAPTGTVNIDNVAPSQGDTLSASNTLADTDGISGSITYQWQRDGINISSATASSYTLTQADVAKAITVVASYVDDGGTAESVSSSATAAVIDVNDAPTASNLNSNTVYVTGNTVVALPDVVISDIDSAEIVSASLTLADTSTGTLSANNGATYNTTTGVWSISGTVANVNTALANLVFNPTTTNTTDTSISVVVDDGDEDASGALIGNLVLNAVLPVAPVNTVVIEEVVEEPVAEVVIAETVVAEEAIVEEEVVVSEEAAAETEEEAAAVAGNNRVGERQVDLNDENIGSAVDAASANQSDSFDIETVAVAGEYLTITNKVIGSEIISKESQAELQIVKINEQFAIYQAPLDLIESNSFISGLDRMREDLVLENQSTDKVVGSSLAVSAGVSVGYVVWLARSGVLLSSVLSSMPAWRFIDPLPILGSMDQRSDNEDSESLESMIADHEKTTTDLEKDLSVEAETQVQKDL